MELIGGIAAQPVDLAAALHRRALADLRRPALQVLVVLHREEFAAAILVVLRQAAIPRPDRDVGDRIFVAGNVLAFRQAPVEDVELALRLHGEAVDRVFYLGLRISIEMAEAAPDIGRAAHLPEEP